jgi:hypothetical protein
MRRDSGLEATPHFAAHACRDIESGVRDVIRGVASLEKGANHRQDVTEILTALEIDPESPIAVLWLDFPTSDTALHKMAHRDRLGVRRQADFESGWEKFQAIMDLVLDRHEGTSGRAFTVIDAILGDASLASLERLQTSIPQNQVTLGYFFEHADARWIAVLRGSSYLTPDESPNDAGAYVPWPAGRWLRRVIGDDPSFAAECLRDLEQTENPDAAAAGLDAVAKLPAEVVATLTGAVVSWVRVVSLIGLEDRGVAVATLLAEAGFGDEALEVSRAILEIGNKPNA